MQKKCGVRREEIIIAFNLYLMVNKIDIIVDKLYTIHDMNSVLKSVTHIICIFSVFQTVSDIQDIKHKFSSTFNN